MKKITAIIPTFNEEIHIQEAIDSVSFADEIIVVDSFSTDKTKEIVLKNKQVTLLEHEYLNSAAQKNWTIPQAKHDWIFLLDADERPTKELIDEIKLTVNKESNETVGYWIRRKNIFMDKELRFIWKNDAVIRLFRKSKCRYEDKHVHAEVICEDGVIGRLDQFLTHDTYRGKGLEFHLKKGERYTNWGARDRVEKVSNINFYHLIIKPLFAFVKHYFLKLGFLDGRVGIIISGLTAYNVFIRSVKIWRLQEGETLKD